VKLVGLDFAIIGAYLLVVIGIGVSLRKKITGSADFLLSKHSIPLWMTGIAFMAANLGSLEVMGMIANGAKYGMMTNHFYWIGAIPAMVFLGLFMMPFYYQNEIRSVPEYLQRRFDKRAHALNAVTFALMTILMSGINMFALAVVFKAMLGWSFDFSVLVSASVVVAYTMFGGLASSIYNEVLQFFLIVAGFLPIAIRGLQKVGGWQGLRDRLPASSLHTWSGLSDSNNGFGVSWVVVSVGLGFVMSFAYWCTDFLLIQRAMAARSLSDARRTPLVAAIPKMFFPILVTLPGLTAAALYGNDLKGDYNQALPRLLADLCGPGWLGLGLTALLASFMSGMAGNVTAFNTVWTYDLYQTYLAPGRSDAHYLKVARGATVVGTGLSVLAAYLALSFDNLMDYMQLVATFFISPLFATFLMGMFWKRCNGTGAFAGMIAGISGAALHYLGYRTGVLHYPTEMAANFNGAIVGWSSSVVVTVVGSWLTAPPPSEKTDKLVYSGFQRGTGPWYHSIVLQGCAILVVATVLNIIFW
jgi:solute:Na+ symporter, SSS family